MLDSWTIHSRINDQPARGGGPGARKSAQPLRTFCGRGELTVAGHATAARSSAVLLPTPSRARRGRSPSASAPRRPRSPCRAPTCPFPPASIGLGLLPPRPVDQTTLAPGLSPSPPPTPHTFGQGAIAEPRELSRIRPSPDPPGTRRPRVPSHIPSAARARPPPPRSDTSSCPALVPNGSPGRHISPAGGRPKPARLGPWSLDPGKRRKEKKEKNEKAPTSGFGWPSVVRS